MIRQISLIGIIYFAIALTAAGTVYVDRDNAQPNPDGLTWATAFPTIQPAIDAAQTAGDHEIWMAEGIYNEPRNSFDAIINGNTGSVVMYDGLAIYGGFTGTETARHQRNTLRHRTVIDGSTSRDGLPAYFVVIGASNIVLDGLEITGGVAGTLRASFGAGFQLRDGENPTLRGCVFRNNLAARGTLSAYSVDGVITIDRCLFIENGDAGVPFTPSVPAIHTYYSDVRILNSFFLDNVGNDAESSDLNIAALEVRHSYFSNNAAIALNATPSPPDHSPIAIFDSDFIGSGVQLGSGVYGGVYSVERTSFTEIGEGGFSSAAYIKSNPDYFVSIKNCLFAANNLSNDTGALVRLAASNYLLEHCTFAGNFTDTPAYPMTLVKHYTDVPVALDPDAAPKLWLRNSILWNTGLPSEVGEADADTVRPLIDDSIVRDGYVGNDIYSDAPQFVDEPLGDFRLTANSRGVDQGQIYNAPEPDILGTPRPVGAAVDMGAFEYVEAPPLLCDSGDRITEQFSRVPFAADELTDLDGDGIPELATIRLMAAAACEYDSPESESIAAAFQQNYMSADAEPFDMRVLRNREMIAALMSVSDASQQTLRDALAATGTVLLNDYAVAECVDAACATAADQGAPLSAVAGDADLDGDGLSNAAEWTTVQAQGGTIDDFVHAALADRGVDTGTETHVSGSCFIATAAYGTTLAAELQPLRNARDTHLLTNPFGAAFTDVYYRLSPPIANFVAQHEDARKVVRAALAPILAILQNDEAAATD